MKKRIQTITRMSNKVRSFRRADVYTRAYIGLRVIRAALFLFASEDLHLAAMMCGLYETANPYL